MVFQGLPGALPRSSSTDIKREEKEDDENCSVTDKSDDEKKDGKMNRTRTRYPTPTHTNKTHCVVMLWCVVKDKAEDS